jgi:hypothetical protein
MNLTFILGCSVQGTAEKCNCVKLKYKKEDLGSRKYSYEDLKFS